MATPTISTVVISQASTTGHTVTLPTYSEGDQIIIIVGTITSVTAEPTINQGYTREDYQTGSSRWSIAVYQKTAGASETAPVVTYADTESVTAFAFSVSGGTLGDVISNTNTSSGSDQVDFPAATATADALVLRYSWITPAGAVINTQPTGTLIGDNLTNYGLWQTTATVGAVPADTLLFTENKRNQGTTLVINEASATFAIDSTDASMQRDGTFDVTFSNPATTPTTGNTSLAQGGDTLTCTSVTGSDPYTATFSVGDLSKQVDATGYDWTLTVDAETDTTGNIPLTIQAGYTLVNLTSPDTTNASLLFGVTGDTPITGDDLEYDVTSTLDSGVTFSVANDGVWTVTEATEGDWVTDITVDRRVVQADGTIGTTATLTLSASTGAVIGIISDLVTDMVTDLVTEMVN